SSCLFVRFVCLSFLSVSSVTALFPLALHDALPIWPSIVFIIGFAFSKGVSCITITHFCIFRYIRSQCVQNESVFLLLNTHFRKRCAIFSRLSAVVLHTLPLFRHPGPAQYTLFHHGQ